MNKDNGFGDAFAREVLNVMNSKEHKAIFSKTAQVDTDRVDMGGIDVDLGGDVKEKALSRSSLGDATYDPTLYSPTPEGSGMNRATTDSVTGEGLGETFVFPDPGVSDQDADMAVLEQKAKDLMADPFGPAMGDPSLAEIANKAMTGQLLTPAEKDLLLSVSASAKSTMGKKGQEHPKIPDFPFSKSEWESLPDQHKKVVVKKFGPPPWEKEAASVLNTLVAVADFFGNKGFVVSEKLTDRLIKSFVVEASSKATCKKCEKEKCKCKCEEDKKKE